MGAKQQCAWRLLPVLAVLPVVGGPALTHVAPRGARAAHAGRRVLTGVQVTHVHTLPSEVPCGDRPASPPPQGQPRAPQAPFQSQTLYVETSWPRVPPDQTFQTARRSHGKQALGGRGQTGTDKRASPAPEGGREPQGRASPLPRAPVGECPLSMAAAPQNSKANIECTLLKMCTFP